MCLADVYKDRDPLPALITFPCLDGIQDMMAFRFEACSRPNARQGRGAEDAHVLVCSAGLWDATPSEWKLRAYEREYCRVVAGSVRIHDHSREWTVTARSSFLLLKGFEGRLEVLEPSRIVYMIFSMPDFGALEWCMSSEGRTALGQERMLT